MKKVYFSQLRRAYVGIIMLAACTKSRFPCFLLVSRVWDISSGIGPYFPLAGGLCKFVPQHQRKMTNSAATTTLSAISSKPIHIYQCTLILHLWLAGHLKNKKKPGATLIQAYMYVDLSLMLPKAQSSSWDSPFNITFTLASIKSLWAPSFIPWHFCNLKHRYYTFCNVHVQTPSKCSLQIWISFLCF